jgi:hypothetical protein
MVPRHADLVNDWLTSMIEEHVVPFAAVSSIIFLEMVDGLYGLDIKSRRATRISMDTTFYDFNLFPLSASILSSVQSLPNFIDKLVGGEAYNYTEVLPQSSITIC